MCGSRRGLKVLGYVVWRLWLPLRNVGGPRRWEPGFLGDLCGLLLLLWVDDAGAWGRDAALGEGQLGDDHNDPPTSAPHTCRVALSTLGRV